jgi:IS30 family transposase
MGAATTASAAYCAATLYQWVVFSRLTHVRLHHLLPDARDAQRLRTLWRRALGR